MIVPAIAASVAIVRVRPVIFPSTLDSSPGPAGARGFTLLELMIVLVIIAILFGFA